MNLFTTDANSVEQIEGMTTEYPYCMHTRDLSDYVIPWHWHEELELGYIREGCSCITTLGAEYTIHQGDGFFINSGVMNTKRNAAAGMKTVEINHIFHPVFLGGHFHSRFSVKYLAPVTGNHQIEVYIIRRGRPNANRILRNLYQLADLQTAEPAFGNEFAVRNILSDTWLLLMQELNENYKTPTGAGSVRQERIRSMLAFIHSHYAEHITVEEIAAAAGVSEREAMRCFRSDLGQSPIGYLVNYRLNQSRQMLSETDLPITQIAVSCGFSDSAYFGKTFRKAFDMSPREYRQKAK